MHLDNILSYSKKRGSLKVKGLDLILWEIIPIKGVLNDIRGNGKTT
jgi:hypothetical protein